MPSLHFGWSLWCGVVIAVLARRWWIKALGMLHPLLTASSIVTTGNHWVLDAVGGALVVGAGFGLVYVLTGPRPATADPHQESRAAHASSGRSMNSV
ncbi:MULTISPECIES: phosphatase PAP2 family protein [Streptomyces]|nr:MULTISPECIES: phosphatase PAP2 family protein [Streptomyces]MYS91705.1 hypothetical protein [Streptomyces sp. SID5464]